MASKIELEYYNRTIIGYQYDRIRADREKLHTELLTALYRPAKK